MDKELQVENGNFTRIVNPLLERLIQIPFKGCELAVAIYIIRKTYGFQKKQDEIPLSQFERDLGRSRQTIVTALKNLQLVEVVRLVKRGNMSGQGNIWIINKYYDTWKLVNMARLVKRNKKGSLTDRLNLVKTARQSKETIKRKDKESSNGVPSQDIQSFIYSFKGINPSYEQLFKNTTERSSSERLISKYGIEKMLKTTEQLPYIILQPYAPRITTPYELERNLGKLIAFISQNKAITSKKETKII